jgi:hypothetical protein
MEKYRVIALNYRRRNHYGERWDETIQYLQKEVKYWFGIKRWKTIDEEEVPSHVITSHMCFGDTGGWESKFKNIPNCEFIKTA